MHRPLVRLTLAIALMVSTSLAAGAPAPMIDEPPFLLGPPSEQGPVVVQARFALQDILEILEHEEVFEFSGVLTLTWKDPRQEFDPVATRAQEKIFQGNYQFNEVATGWYPQVVLVNDNDAYKTTGVVLRVQPDGTSTLTTFITGAAEVDLDLRRFPFDEQRLEAVFEVLAFDQREIRLEVESGFANPFPAGDVRVPQWRVTGYDLSVRDRHASYAGARRVSSAFIVGVNVARDSFHVRRLVTLPLAVIVLLSFSVFWMDRSTLGDRLSVSFIGILTGVTYQLVISDEMPRISYYTLINGFLTLSFLTMCATVVINLVVGTLDQKGEQALGDRIDHRCRWLFPLVYFGLNGAMLAVAFQ